MISFFDAARVKELWDKINKTKQDKLAGNPGQLIGIGDDGAAAATVYPLNPNLLDNWYLADPINQRGANTYTGRLYGIDRWMGNTDATSVTVEANGLRINGTILQKFPKELRAAIAGQMVTMSVLLAEGELKTGTGAAPAGANTTWLVTGSDLRLSLFDDGSTMMAVTSLLSENNVIAVKFELGGYQTLAHKEKDKWVLNDPPPNKAIELIKCQRYYQLFPSDSAVPGGVAPTVSAPIKKEAFRPNMQSDITASKYGTIYINGNAFCYADANL